MTSTVVCGYTGANWEINSVGQDACVQYAHLVGTCQPSFTIGPVTPQSPPYLPSSQNAACACNVVAYNLQAACGWCQDAIEPSWWATQSQWSGNCSALGTTYNPTGLPPSVSTASLTIPQWALATVNALENTWDQTTASLLASPLATGGGGTTNLGGGLFTTPLFTTYNPYTYNPYNYNPYGAVVAASGTAIAIGVGVTVGIWALTAIIVGVVFFTRQKRRKAWYGPTAAFYREGGAGGPGQPLVAAPVFFNDPSATGSPHPTNAPSLPSQSPAPSAAAYTPYQPPPSGPYQPYANDPRQSYVPPPGSAASGGGYSVGGGYPGPEHGYPPNATPVGQPGTNPFTTPYGTPGAGGPQGPPPGAANPHGYGGHAEVY